MSNRELETELDAAMNEIYHRLKAEAKFDAVYFFNLLSTLGGIKTAKILFATEQPTEGFKNIAERNRLDLTVEALVLKIPKFQTLFNASELKNASDRLDQFNYNPPNT